MSTSALEELPALAAAKVSFRSSTANAWAASYVRYLNTELEHHRGPDAQRLMSQVCHATQVLFNARSLPRPETQSSTVLGMCALMLASYQQLSADTGRSDLAHDLVKRGFDQAYQAFIQNIAKPLLLNHSRSPQTLAGMNFKAWSERLYPNDRSRHALAQEGDITGYHLFFMEQGAPALAQIIQRADEAWMAAVASYGQSQLGESRRTRATDAAVEEEGFVPFRFAPRGRGRTSCQQDVILELQLHAVAGDRRSYTSNADRRHHWSGVDRRQAGRRQDDERAWQ